jgi:hypothetical protein
MSKIWRKVTIGALMTHQEIERMYDCLPDELLADIPQPYLPWPFALLEMPLDHERRNDHDTH